MGESQLHLLRDYISMRDHLDPILDDVMHAADDVLGNIQFDVRSLFWGMIIHVRDAHQNSLNGFITFPYGQQYLT